LIIQKNLKNQKKLDVTIELILHATENFQKVYDVFYDLFTVEKDDIMKHELVGHFGNPIFMLNIQIKKIKAHELIKKLISMMPKSELDLILNDLENRIDNSSLYLRFSKQSLLEKIIKLEEKDPIRMKIYTPVYVKKEIIDVYRKLLEI
jgi:RNA binding exosome subunit